MDSSASEDLMERGSRTPAQDEEEERQRKWIVRAANALRLLRHMLEDSSLTMVAFGVVFVLTVTVHAAIPFTIATTLKDIEFDAGAQAATDMEFAQFYLVVLLFVAGDVLAFVRDALFQRLAGRVDKRLRSDLFESVMMQDVAYLESISIRFFINRLWGDLGFLNRVLAASMARWLSYGVDVAVGVLVLFALSWRLTLALIAPTTIVWVGVWLVYKRWFVKVAYEGERALLDANTVAEQALDHLQLLRQCGKEGVEVGRFSSLLEDYAALRQKNQRAHGGFEAFVRVQVYTTLLFVGGLGAQLADGVRGAGDGAAGADDSGAFMLSDLVAYMLYALYLMYACRFLFTRWSELTNAMDSTSIVFVLIDKVPDLNLGGGRVLNKVQGVVALRQVYFAYPSQKDTPVLKAMDLTLHAGEVSCLVGGAGQGKSTIAHLLLKHYEPNVGLLSLDNLNVQELDPYWIRTQIGYVAEQPVMLPMTVREYVALPRNDEPTHMEVEDVCKAVGVHDDVVSLPKGYDTRLEENRFMLTQPQLQQLALARELLKHPSVLIVDNVDSLGEDALARLPAVAEYAAGCTVVLMNRLLNEEMLGVCSRVYLLESGRVQEEGTPAELKEANSSLYRRHLA